jgi:hypothetical protein
MASAQGNLEPPRPQFFGLAHYKKKRSSTDPKKFHPDVQEGYSEDELAHHQTQTITDSAADLTHTSLQLRLLDQAPQEDLLRPPGSKHIPKTLSAGSGMGHRDTAAFAGQGRNQLASAAKRRGQAAGAGASIDQRADMTSETGISLGFSAAAEEAAGG